MIGSAGEACAIQDVPALIAATDKECEGCYGEFNKALQRITGHKTPLKGYRTDKQAWEKWWEENKDKISFSGES